MSCSTILHAFPLRTWYLQLHAMAEAEKAEGAPVRPGTAQLGDIESAKVDFVPQCCDTTTLYARSVAHTLGALGILLLLSLVTRDRCRQRRLKSVEQARTERWNMWRWQMVTVLRWTARMQSRVESDHGSEWSVQ